MRRLLHSLPVLLVLFFAACDSGFDPLPDVVPEVLFTVDVQAPNRAVSGVIPISGRCSLTVGGLRESPERIAVMVDGDEIDAVNASEIEVEAVLSAIGPHTITVDCRFEDESHASQRTVEVVEPALVIVHLRNFTQPGEPFVYDEGPITFTVGEMQITSSDSVVVPVLPDAEYEIFAEHVDFVPLWARITDHDTGEVIEFYHVRDQSSPVHVATSASIDVFKIRESDITSIQNRHQEFLDDNAPHYTIENLRQALYDDWRPYSAGLNRLTMDKVTVWPGVNDLQRAAGVRAAVQKIFVVVGPNHVSNLTGGVVQYSELVTDLARPAERPLVEIRFSESTWHTEYVTPDGALSHSEVHLPATASLGTATAMMLQAIGLRGTIGYDPVDDYVDENGIPSQFAKLALKILYASPTNARF